MSRLHNNRRLTQPSKIRAIPLIALLYFNSYLNQFFGLLNLLYIHLFAFATLIPMPIFDLLNTITSKYTHAFSSFLQAYSDIKQMKNIPQNLSVISQCILNEYAQGTSKCLNYYIAHEMDKIFLNLNEYSNLETFYLSILPVMSEGYLNSDFFNEAWKYKKFFKLAKVYSERCLSMKLFNFDFADSLIQTFPDSKDSVIILCEMDAYLNHFRENKLGDTVISLINSSIQNRRDEAIELFQFLIFFEDKGSLDLLAKIDFIHLVDQGSRDISKDIPNTSEHDTLEDFNNQSDVIEFYNSEFRYFFSIFKHIKSVKIRRKVLELIPVLAEHNRIKLTGCFNFILECIKIDPLSVSGAMNHYQESNWSPLKVHTLIMKYYYPSNDIISETSAATESVLENLNNKEDTNLILLYLPVEANDMPVLSKIMKDENLVDACLKMKLQNRKILKNSKLFDLFLKKAPDVRIFSFLIFVNETLILNNLETILDAIEDKEDFCKLLWQRLFIA